MHTLERFAADYVEHLRLRGRDLRVRWMTPADSGVLDLAFTALSDASRARRCFNARNRLSESELDRFTRLDFGRHAALGVFALSDEGGDERDLVGVAQFAHREEEPGTAELALTVADEWQGAGLGAMLADRLARAAAAHGVKRLRADWMVGNVALASTLDRVFGSATPARTEGVYTREIDVRAFAGAHGRRFDAAA